MARRFQRSLVTRVTALTTLCVALAIIALSFGLYVTVGHRLSSSLDQSLIDRAQAAATDPELIKDLQSGAVVPTWALGAADLRAAFLHSDGHVVIPDRITGNFPALGSEEAAVLAGTKSYSLRTTTIDGESYRLVAVKVARTDTVLLLADSLTDEQTMLAGIARVTALCGLLGILLAAVAGGLAVAAGLRPIGRLTADVDRIARTQDLSPIPVVGEDEIARLSARFNDLLAALAASRVRQRQLVADASHELRTPLTSLRTNVDLLTQADQELPEAQRAELLADLRAQITELTTLIGDLVELARDEPQAHTVETVDVADVLDTALDRVRRRAPRLTWQVAAQPWLVDGERNGLERAVTNLLDNAAKWSPDDGIVTVTLDAGTLTVDDQGPGIPAADLPHVFDRFYRSREARSMAGSGLGLAIVRQVAERHGGSVAATAAPGGGARLTLRLAGRAD